METKIAKVLDNGRRDKVDLKRKRTVNCDTYVTGASRKLLSKRMALNAPINKVVVKKRNLDGSNNKFDCGASQFKTSLLKYYSNFTRSGIPQRVMFYQNGQWNDFPDDFVTLLKKELQVKKAVIDMEYNGRSFFLDFLHMVKLDSRTGSSQPIAWIDDSAKCFFPETFSTDDEYQEDLFSVPAYQDIRLQLEIEVKDSKALAKQNCDDEKSACNLDAEDSCAKPFDIGESKQGERNGVPNIEYGDLDIDDVKKLFSMGMGSSVSADIVNLYCGFSSLVQARLELFYKQVEITNKYRQDANVRYAWLPTTKEALPSIMTYGLGHIETSEMKSTYGIGIHLSPANCAFNSASYCDVDENGVQHMVFCRVIMGNMELVHEGSKQFHPSGEDFDSGVDDLQNPSHFIVWNMNRTTHIYPEYAVSFKISSGAAGLNAVSPERPICPLDTSLAQSIPVENVEENVPKLGSSTTRSLKSPWFAISTLLAAMSNNIRPEVMKLLQSDHELLRNKKISRQDFIRNLRLTVGDTLLKSAIKDLLLEEKGSNESNQLAGKVEFAPDKDMKGFNQLAGRVQLSTDKEKLANESEQVARKVEVVVDKVLPNFGNKPVA